MKNNTEIMKKIILTLALLIFSCTAWNAAAQNQDTDYKKELRHFLLQSGSVASFDTIIDQVIPLMAGSLSEASIEEIRSRSYDELVDLMLVLYQENISLEDLKAYNKFFQTPAGKRIAAAQPQVVQASMQIGQAWAGKLQQIIQEVMAR